MIWWLSSPERGLRRAYRNHRYAKKILLQKFFLNLLVSIRARIALALLNQQRCRYGKLVVKYT